MLREDLTTLFEEYRVPVHMLQHGLSLLETVVNIHQSNENRLVLVEEGSWHLISRGDNCHNMCYLLLKHLQSVSNSIDDSNQTIYRFTRLYGGQTVNFPQREFHRRGHVMHKSNIKICIGHDLTQYQMDCLETTSIAFLLLLYGMRTTNRTVFSKFVYREIPDGVEINDQNSHPDPEEYGVSTIGLLRRALVIGTCPPEWLLTSREYERNLSEWMTAVNSGRVVSNPVLNIDRLAERSDNIRALGDQLRSDDGYLPEFIDHHPTIPSGNFNDQIRDLQPTELLDADRRVQRSISMLRKDVIIMLGARPTLLFAKEQRRKFFALVCPFVDLYWLSKDRCGFVLWWPHLGLRGHTNKRCIQLLEQIWRLLSHRLHLLLFIVNEESPNPDTNGLSENKAAEIVKLINDHPTTLQLQQLLITLTQYWSEPYISDELISSYSTVESFEIIRTYTDNTSISNLPSTDEDLVFTPPLVEVPNTSLSEVIQNWSMASTVRLMNKAIRMVPNFHALEESEASLKLQVAARMEIMNLRKGWMDKYISAGLFFPFEEETSDQQFTRFFRMINMQRMLRGTHPSSIQHTCCWCGQEAFRVPQRNGRVNFSTVKQGCPNSRAHSLGWEALPGKFDELFPSSNIFLMFFEYLPTGEVLNHWQLASAFISYITQNLWHVQARTLNDRYGQYFPLITSFRLNENAAGPGAVFLMSVTLAMGKLARLDPPCNVEVGSRSALPEEVAWSDGFRLAKKNLIGIRVLLTEEEKTRKDLVLAKLEDFRHMGYGEALGIVRTYRDIISLD